MSGAVNVIMPVLGMSQDSGKLVRWIKKSGEWVEKGEPLMEVETDKATVEIEAPASGVLTQVTAKEGDDVPVAHVIALIQEGVEAQPVLSHGASDAVDDAPENDTPITPAISPVAARIAAEYHLDVGKIKPDGKRIEKSDVMAYLEGLPRSEPSASVRQILASPKARRLAAERGIDITSVAGSGPGGAVLANDLPPVLPAAAQLPFQPSLPTAQGFSPSPGSASETDLPMSAAWGRMVERLSNSWPNTPHFYLVREVNASRLIAWRQAAQEQSEAKITYTDLLVKLVALALRRHPRVNARYHDGKLIKAPNVDIGIAVATDEDLFVPVIHNPDTLRLAEIAAARIGLVERARTGKLRLDDLQGGTYTISNLGMYGIDAFNAMINPGQSAILAVGRIADRVVALEGQVRVQPMMVISASFDHRVVDGARGAQFLQNLAEWIEEPLVLLK